MASIAIDIGATKTLVAMTFNGKIKKIVQFLTPKKRSETLKKIGDAISSFKVKPKRICAAIAGTIEKKKVRQFTNLDGWKDFDLKSYLKKRYKAESFVINDGDAAAIAEMFSTGYKDIVALTIGTGMGVGAIIGGELVEGPEMGHIIIQANGELCKCGSYGCLEAYTCTEAVKRMTKERYGREMDSYQLKELYKKHDLTARFIYREMGRALGVGLTSMINTFHPDAIVLSGGLMNNEIFGVAKKNIRETLYSKPKVLLSKIREHSSLMGAMHVAEGRFVL
ncbi:MAG: ROK family protein [Candidatus Woesearchaeota archaeon]